MSTKIVQQFYPNLVEILPMNNAIFMAELFSRELLPDDLKEHIELLPTSAKKSSYFLDHVIKPSVTSGDASRFDELLNVMEDSEYQGVNELAKLIRDSIRTVDNGGHSEELAATVKLCSIDISRLKLRYLNQPSTCKTDWSKHNVFYYVKLALVEKEDVTLRDNRLNEITKLTLKSEVDKILKKKQPLYDLKDIFYYENKPCPRLILIMGGPGIGKTTLANQICLQWARDGFLANEFDSVVMIPLRSVQERSLEEVMMQSVGEEDYPKLKKSAGSRCLLILEGLDEMAANRRQSDVILKRLLEENTLLEKAKILITSRPHACEKLVVDRRVEIVGFGDKEIRELVDYSFFNDVESVEEFMKQLTEYPQLRSLCYVPLNLVMIIDIFRFSQNKLPSTLTELYRLFIVMILQREVVKGCSVKKLTVGDNIEVTLSKMLPGIPKKAIGIIYLLCKLAYYAFFKSYSDMEEKDRFGRVKKKWRDPKIIFTELDLTESGIEVTSKFCGFFLLRVVYVHQLPRDTVTYNFLHLTVQEFLCSLYISTLSQQEQLNLLSEHFSDYPNVMMYICGLTQLASKAMFKTVCSKLIMSSSKGFSPSVVTAVRCIYEATHSDPSQLTSPFILQMSDSTLSPYNCLCLSWILSYFPVSHLKIRNCCIEDAGAKLLVRHYPNNNTTLTNNLTIAGLEDVMKIKTSSTTLRVLDVTGNEIGELIVRHYPNNHTTGQLLEELNLAYNNLTIAGLEDVMKILRTSSATLRVLDFMGNGIGNDGISMMSEKLQHFNSLTELSIAQCGLLAKGAIAVSKILIGNCTLQVLNVSYNSIGDDGISVIVEQLQYITTLTKLYVRTCGFSVKGATVISKLLMDNCMIQELQICGNKIGDDGITAIATALTNSGISQLWVMECGITLTGARSIATLLSANHTISNFMLLSNPITTEGAHLILQSAVNNKACEVDIWKYIDYEYLSDSEVRTMINILRDRFWRKRMKNKSWLPIRS